MSKKKIFNKGLLRENPVFVMLLGMCPALAVTASAINGMGMGLATTFVLVMSSIIVAMIKHLVPSKVRIPTFIVIIASFVTIVDLVMAGYLPVLHAQLGLFIPLIVVNCLVLGRAEAFASKNKISDATLDGLGMGLGFTGALTLLGASREILGAGSLFDFKFIEGDGILVFILAPGAFIALAYLIAIINRVRKKQVA
jgi:Na+-translocating ferredoxin:NAD+ oxidoreductase subunit E